MYQAGYRMKDFFTFLFKRICRLEPPYIVSLALAVALLYLRGVYIGHLPSTAINPTQVALHLGYLIPFFKDYQWLNMVYWTLALEFQYYLFIALLYSLITHSSAFARYSAYALMLGLSLIRVDAFFFPWLPVFLLGILLFLVKVNKIKQVEYYSITAIAIIFCLFTFNPMAILFCALPLILILWKPDLKVYGLDTVGRYSYSLYLMHPMIGTTFINVLSHHCVHPLAKLLVIAAGIGLSLGTAWLLYLVVEKPSARLSSSIKYGDMTVPAYRKSRNS